jgi:hypothetical protein
VVKPRSNIEYISFSALRSPGCPAPINYGIDYTGPGMKLIKETETNGKIELDGTSFSDMMSIPVVLTAKYED